jgi:nickel-dependent lactate racemase
MAQVSFPFAQSLVEIDIPDNNLIGVYSPKETPPIQDLDAAINLELSGYASSNFVKASDKVLIVSDDNTRLTPTDKIIPALIGYLNKAGVSNENISCIMALGTHRYMTQQEMVEKVGQRVYDSIKVFNHEWMDENNLVDIGISSLGTPLEMNRAVVQADVVIGIGSVVPHHIPGFSGSGKIIQPGVSGPKTTAATHLLSCSAGGDSLLGIKDNPVRADLEEIAEKVNMKVIFNVVLNHHGQTVGTFFGPRQATFDRAVEKAREVYGFTYSQTPDIVIVNSCPCDLDFWQSHKSQYPAQKMVKPGGVIIVCTPAPEGISPVHKDLLTYTSWSSKHIMEACRTGVIANGVAGALATAWAMVREKADVIMYSPGISPEDKKKLGHTHAPSVDWALKEALKRQGPDAKITVLTHAPDMLPIKEV